MEKQRFIKELGEDFSRLLLGVDMEDLNDPFTFQLEHISSMWELVLHISPGTNAPIPRGKVWGGSTILQKKLKNW